MSDLSQLGPLRAGLIKYRDKRISNSSGSSQPGDAASATAVGSPEKLRKGPMTQFADRLNNKSTSKSVDLTWSSLCAEARAEADRKRGLALRVQEASDFQRWLITDISQQALKRVFACRPHLV
ncbi:hypothetical protein Vretimale_16074 [Volvox reticuliferus]|uniref:Uncharacterized protein n=1 Tax=Volvox reticuliferus TaxID=1737510 RepID=A0A8J4GT64_9CHLO|nr:hypothetical protein Vretifemale_9689 [Volvox reticuliferus]GIM12838.1 hypothetical protein Vretimale_16074 [Volvox reticuliferus]